MTNSLIIPRICMSKSEANSRLLQAMMMVNILPSRFRQNTNSVPSYMTKLPSRSSLAHLQHLSTKATNTTIKRLQPKSLPPILQLCYHQHYKGTINPTTITRTYINTNKLPLPNQGTPTITNTQQKTTALYTKVTIAHTKSLL
jgi:hypothetical protein